MNCNNAHIALSLRLLHSLWLLVSGTTFYAQGNPRPLPPSVPPYTFVENDGGYRGFYLSTPFRLNGPAGVSRPAIILDSAGYVRWYADLDARSILDFKYHANTRTFQLIAFQNPFVIDFVLLDTAFFPTDTIRVVNDVLPDAHDFQISASGTYLISGVYDSLFDLSNVWFGNEPGSPNTTVRGFAVQEVDEDGNLIFQWKSTDHIPPEQGYDFYGYQPNRYNYCHGNSIDEADDGSLLLSFRHLNAVYLIERPSGAVRWRLGGKNSSFVFTNDQGFSGQHDARILPNGNIALFDNGNMASPNQISRAVEYQLDTLNWTAAKVWEYVSPAANFSPSMGGHQTTPDRLHLIEYGYSFRPAPSFVLADDDGYLLTEVFMPDSFMAYRSYLFDLPLKHTPQPEISCAHLDEGLLLSAPSGYARYQWSTGDTTQEIVVSQEGTYQVWVSHGIGMLGSAPWHLDDMETDCQASHTQEADDKTKATVIGYYDMLGRRLYERPPARQQLYMVRFSDGTARLKFE